MRTPAHAPELPCTKAMSHCGNGDSPEQVSDKQLATCLKSGWSDR